ncbi:MAG: hypothetical protein U0165_14455 [Polyangiaceae bacterium]
MVLGATGSPVAAGVALTTGTPEGGGALVADAPSRLPVITKKIATPPITDTKNAIANAARRFCDVLLRLCEAVTGCECEADSGRAITPAAVTLCGGTDIL